MEANTKAKHVRNRMRDLFDESGNLHRMNTSTPLELNELLGSALTNYVYVKEGDSYGHNQRRTVNSLPRCGVKLKNSFVIGCLNCNGLGTSMAGIEKLLQHSNIDLFLLLETMTRENKSCEDPIMGLFNKNKISENGNVSSHYGVGYALNPKYYNKEKVNVVRIDDCFVQINFKNFNVIACYLPPKQLLESFAKIKGYINGNTILIGDFNADLECPRSSDEVELINLLTEAGLEYQQYKDYFSYQKNRQQVVLNEKSFGTKLDTQVQDILATEDHGSFRVKGCSKIDHCLVRNDNGSIKTINVYTEECTLNFSDHKCICAQIDLHQADTFVVGKQSRLKVHKLIADNQIKDGIQVNKNEQNLFNYQHAVKLGWSNDRVDREWLEIGINNVDRHVMDRQKDMDQWIELFDQNLFTSLDTTVKQTKAMPMLSNKDLERIYSHQKEGNVNLAKELIQNLNENYVETFADKINNMKTHEVQKIYKAHKCRISRPGAGLDQNKLLEYW